jgi:hypothetical protein
MWLTDEADFFYRPFLRVFLSAPLIESDFLFFRSRLGFGGGGLLVRTNDWKNMNLLIS